LSGRSSYVVLLGKFLVECPLLELMVNSRLYILGLLNINSTAFSRYAKLLTKQSQPIRNLLDLSHHRTVPQIPLPQPAQNILDSIVVTHQVLGPVPPQRYAQ